jgi:hypothetical protein
MRCMLLSCTVLGAMALLAVFVAEMSVLNRSKNNSNSLHALPSDESDGSTIGSILSKVFDSCVERRILWVVALAKTDDLTVNLFKASVLSALEHAPSLVPVIVYACKTEELPPFLFKYANTSLIHLLPHKLSFLDHLVRLGKEDIQGIFYRLDLPAIYPKLSHILAVHPTANANYILYTDTDVLFFRDVSYCHLPKPKLIGMTIDRRFSIYRASYYKSNPILNSGVIVANIRGLTDAYPSFLEYVLFINFTAGNFDQGIINDYYCKNELLGCSVLPYEYNWRGWWGGSYRSLFGGDVTPIIAHFHCGKPSGCIECLLTYRHDKSVCVDRGSCYSICANRFYENTDHAEFYERMLVMYERYTLS